MLSAKATDPNPKQKRSHLQGINKQDDRFISSLLSKESSMANPSFRVYYGGFAGSVPFIWESQPGTPKHSMAARFSDESSLPPLTPPPSSFRSSDEPMKVRSSMFRRLMMKICPRKPAGTRSMLVPVKTMDYLRRRHLSSRGSSFDSVIFADHVDDDEHDVTSRLSGRFMCFGIRERTRSKLCTARRAVSPSDGCSLLRRGLTQTAIQKELPDELPRMPLFDHSPQPYYGPSVADRMAKRKEFLSPSLFHFYKDPINIVEGTIQYLFDDTGRRYQDAFGGIPTVSCGHCHPDVCHCTT